MEVARYVERHANHPYKRGTLVHGPPSETLPAGARALRLSRARREKRKATNKFTGRKTLVRRESLPRVNIERRGRAFQWRGSLRSEARSVTEMCVR